MLLIVLQFPFMLYIISTNIIPIQLIDNQKGIHYVNDYLYLVNYEVVKKVT
ncbi:hypothetical protein HanIR_Chr05g0225551 [Helianthus annuus]|nr:hypothetical protein HanIR_Chr05g0225551 [Helianthus annuus]